MYIGFPDSDVEYTSVFFASHPSTGVKSIAHEHLFDIGPAARLQSQQSVEENMEKFLSLTLSLIAQYSRTRYPRALTLGGIQL